MVPLVAGDGDGEGDLAGLRQPPPHILPLTDPGVLVALSELFLVSDPSCGIKSLPSSSDTAEFCQNIKSAQRINQHTQSNPSSSNKVDFCQNIPSVRSLNIGTPPGRGTPYCVQPVVDLFYLRHLQSLMPISAQTWNQYDLLYIIYHDFIFYVRYMCMNSI